MTERLQAVSLIKQTDPLLRQMRLTEAQAAGRACISMHCETPDAEPTEDEQLTVRVEGVIRVLPVRRCRPCALKQGGYTVIVGESLGGGR